MASFTIKNIPPELLESLRTRASRERRSLTQEIIYLLEKAALSDSQASRLHAENETELQCAAWTELAGRWRSNKASEDEIAEIYAARSPGREVNL